MRFLITGTAGFIGFHLAQRLLAEGHDVVGIDGITPYYDQSLKSRRHEVLAKSPRFRGHVLMLEEASKLCELLVEASADTVIHLAAQPGVRYSAMAPQSYVSSNIVGTFNLIEAICQRPCGHFLVASTSAVYGASAKQPFEETFTTDCPISLYAATKKAMEVLAFNFAFQSGIPTTAMRFFTVYGPWGRPDMAIFKFTDQIINGKPIDVYGSGNMTRDFTYVDDVVEATLRLIPLPPGTAAAAQSGAETAASSPPYRVVNIGAGSPIGLEEFISIIEEAVGRKALRNNLPIQPGEVPATWASVALLERLTGFKPAITPKTGVRAFVDWYRTHYDA